MERPALTRLLDDVRARRIDVIVVYKVDRLTEASVVSRRRGRASNNRLDAAKVATIELLASRLPTGGCPILRANRWIEIDDRLSRIHMRFLNSAPNSCQLTRFICASNSFAQLPAVVTPGSWREWGGTEQAPTSGLWALDRFTGANLRTTRAQFVGGRLRGMVSRSQPKNRWPFQLVPVIALATCDRLL